MDLCEVPLFPLRNFYIAVYCTYYNLIEYIRTYKEFQADFDSPHTFKKDS